MATYFISPTGSDGNNGLSSGAAWLTLAHHNAASIAGGSLIQLERGGIWRENLQPKATCTYGAYGTGAKPSIRGSNVAGSWTAESGLWYLSAITTDPMIVVHNGVVGRRRTSKAALAQDWDYWWDDPNDRLYVRLATNPAAAVVEYGVRSLIAGEYPSASFTYNDLDVRHSRNDPALGFYQPGSITVAINRCDFIAHGGYGIQVNSGGTVLVDECHFENWGTRRATTADNYAVQVIGAGTTVDVTDSTFVMTTDLPHADVMAINNDTGGWLRTCTGNTITGNASMDEGILVYQPGTQATTIDINDNRVVDCGGLAIDITSLEGNGGAPTLTIARNVIANACTADEADTSAVRFANFTTASTVRFHHNVIDGTFDGANVHHGVRCNASRGVIIANNLVRGCDDGIRLDNDFAIRTPTATVVNNISTANRGAAGLVTGSGTITEHHNLWHGTRTGFTADGTDVLTQPSFVGAGHPYHLRPGSPGAGVGVGIAGITDTASSSMGAFERPLSVLPVGPPRYFVDSAAAGGGNGSEASPWNELADLPLVVPGTKVHLVAGSTFREALTARPGVRYQAHGVGAAPVISGANVLTGFTQEANPAEETGGIFSSGMETASFTDWTSVDQTAVTITRVSSPTPAHGTYSARVAANGTANDNRGGLRRTITVTVGDTIYMRGYVYFPTGSMGSSGQWKGFNIGSDWASLNWNGSAFTGMSVVMGNGGVFVGTFNGGTITLNAWNYVEVAWRIHASAGGAQCWINGTSIGSAFNQNTSASAGSRTAQFGNTGFSAILAASQSHYLDDFRIDSSAIGAFVGGDPHRWTKTVTTEPPQVFVDGVRGQRVASATAATSYRQWHWASNVLTVCDDDTDGTAPTVEVSVRDHCVDVPDGTDGVVLTGLALTRAAGSCVNLGDLDGITITGNVISDAYIEGIQSHGAGPRADLVVTDNTITGCGGSGIDSQGEIDTFTITDNAVTACCQLNHVDLGGHSRHQFSAGIKHWGNAQSGECTDLVITRNEVSDCVQQFGGSGLGVGPGHGIWLDHIVAPVTRPQVTYNAVDNCRSRGIFVEKTDDSDVHHNTVTASAHEQYTASLVVEANNYPLGSASGNVIAHNTVHGGYWPMALNRADGGSLVDNEFRNNIAYANDGEFGVELYVASGADNTGGSSGNVFANNCFGANASNMIQWGSTAYATIAAWQAAVALADDNVAGDPDLVDPPDDLTLEAGSPCIDAGMVLAGINDGYLGAAPDLGYAEKA